MIERDERALKAYGFAPVFIQGEGCAIHPDDIHVDVDWEEVGQEAYDKQADAYLRDCDKSKI